jgi:hypothetical protein
MTTSGAGQGAALGTAFGRQHLVRLADELAASPAMSLPRSTSPTELFDFTCGWAYVIGVGVAGGILLRFGGQPGVPPAEPS